ncbi:hypothetical protein R1flu_019118 [Riccia fluitans]|uniref:Uncharacterized protein n=1 Tax=Riccia fluitans TaxID=41844 RepID=A0ABD1ZJ91_9MARC
MGAGEDTMVESESGDHSPPTAVENFEQVSMECQDCSDSQNAMDSQEIHASASAAMGWHLFPVSSWYAFGRHTGEGVEARENLSAVVHMALAQKNITRKKSTGRREEFCLVHMSAFSVSSGTP